MQKRRTNQEMRIRRPAKPFFLYCAFNAPHYPLQAPEEEVKKYDGKYAEGWDVLRKRRHEKQLKSGLLPAKWKLSPRAAHIPAWDSLSAEQKQWEEDRMEVYAAMIDVLDQNIGRLLNHLKDKGLYDNTLIMFCSDNGACPFDRTRGKEHKPWDPKSYWCYDVGWASVGNTPFRLYKQNQHEGGISSPMIVHGPDSLLKTKPGSVTRQPAHLIDFMATCLEVGKASYPKTVAERKIDPLQGKSLLPILAGQGSKKAKAEEKEAVNGHADPCHLSDSLLRRGPGVFRNSRESGSP
jgi:arylsulfatase